MIKQLKNPPIREALIDIRVEFKPGFDVKILEELHSKFKDYYPVHETQVRFQGQLNLQKGQKSEQKIKEEIRGFLFKNKEQNQIVQFRIDGFTFSRLEPYENWEKFEKSANELWEIYKQHSDLLKITRIAVRFINVIKIPSTHFQKLNLYLNNPPKVPKGIKPDIIADFLDRLHFVFKQDHYDIQSIVTQTSLRSTEKLNHIPYILDIDVFIDKISLERNFDIWVYVQNLRKIKNDIFKKFVGKESINKIFGGYIS